MKLSLTPFRTLAAGAFLSLAACGAAPDSGKTLKIGDQLHALKSSLDVSGEGAPTGYKIEWANFVGGPPIIAAQTGGSLDVGWMAETPLIFAQAAGSPVKVVAVSKTVAGGGSPYALVVKPDSPIRSIADLKGKSVSFMKGTVLHYFVARLLDKQGLSLKDIKTVQATGFGTGLLDKGSADAITIGEPYLTQALDAGKVRVLASGAPPNTPGFFYLVASDAALADPVKAKAIGDLVARAARATRWQRENPAKAAPALAKRYNVDAAVAEKIITRAPASYAPIDDAIIAAHQDEADLFFKEGLIRKKLDAAQIFDKRYDDIVAAQESAK
ncbi:Aliphatic sulfonate ABC transporter periplasmic ligand-binding protein [Sphingopyxis sp. LC81]|uniref:aliphatic sulfonate ABC transporter substrate-binding protein n=1 Tax=Sphingopyxis sp. LC81 TaxID=1502850 RepID=UPI00050F045D|nr:aliphatic sulfonate ABC transporter substrate-binding protein [Sphingopyxis sp. LC81]KGB56948.1 Aliphatic sulfonate ABC transporter periplasmic ligand-binding protein [Sphingopyxis sp. LC81]